MPPRRSKQLSRASARAQAARDDLNDASASPRASPYPPPSRQTPLTPQPQTVRPPGASIQLPAPVVKIEPLDSAQPPITEQRLALLEQQLMALQNPPPVLPTLPYQHFHYPLGASLPYAPVIPLQGPVDLPRQSFSNTRGENQIFDSILVSLPFIKKKLVEDIWYNRLSLDGFNELALEPIAYLDTGEAPKIREMLRGLEIYNRIVCWFTERQIVFELADAFSVYRVLLLSFLGTYTFESVRTFHQTFVRCRLLLKQDDPAGWTTRNKQIEDVCLVPRPVTRQNAYLA